VHTLIPTCQHSNAFGCSPAYVQAALRLRQFSAKDPFLSLLPEPSAIYLVQASELPFGIDRT